MCLPGLFRGAVAALVMAVFSIGSVGAASGSPAPLDATTIQGLELAYEREVQERAEPSYEAGLQKLNESYRVAVDAALKKFTAAGRLDEVLAMRLELADFTAKGTVPAADGPGTNAEVARLRKAWRTENDRLLQQRNAVVKQIASVYAERWRLLEVEFTKASKLEEAVAARVKREQLVASLSAPSTPLATPPAGGRTAGPPVPAAGAGTPFGSSAPAGDAMDVYASGSNGCVVYLNDKVVLPKVMRDEVSKIRLALKEGDVIAVKNQDRFDINSFWLSCIAPSGEFLFATSTRWTSYLPADYDQWWDVKSAKKTKSVQYAPDTQEYVALVKKSASSTPHYHKAQPIRSMLKDNERPKNENFLFYVVTKNDLVPKKVD